MVWAKYSSLSVDLDPWGHASVYVNIHILIFPIAVNKICIYTYRFTPTYLCIYQYLYLYLCLYLICMYIYVPIYLCIRLSMYLSIYLSNYLPRPAIEARKSELRHKATNQVMAVTILAQATWNFNSIRVQASNKSIPSYWLLEAGTSNVGYWALWAAYELH